MVGPCIGSMGHLTTITNRKDQNVIKIGENVLLFDLALISGQMTRERIFWKIFFRANSSTAECRNTQYPGGATNFAPTIKCPGTFCRVFKKTVMHH